MLLYHLHKQQDLDVHKDIFSDYISIDIGKRLATSSHPYLSPLDSAAIGSEFRTYYYFRATFHCFLFAFTAVAADCSVPSSGLGIYTNRS